MRESETVRINGRLYRKFIRFPEEITDGTLRCIRCGQIDEEEYHDQDICVAAFQPVSELQAELEPGLLPCPFCGSSNVDPRGWASNDGSHGPACDNCCGSAQTIELWNSRPLVRHEAELSACKAALDEYNAALQRREHGGVAASRCVEALEKIFYPEKFQPAGAVRQASQEN